MKKNMNITAIGWTKHGSALGASIVRSFLAGCETSLGDRAGQARYRSTPNQTPGKQVSS